MVEYVTATDGLENRSFDIIVSNSRGYRPFLIDEGFNLHNRGHPHEVITAFKKKDLEQAVDDLVEVVLGLETDLKRWRASGAVLIADQKFENELRKSRGHLRHSLHVAEDSNYWPEDFKHVYLELLNIEWDLSKHFLDKVVFINSSRIRTTQELNTDLVRQVVETSDIVKPDGTPYHFTKHDTKAVALAYSLYFGHPKGLFKEFGKPKPHIGIATNRMEVVALFEYLKMAKTKHQTYGKSIELITPEKFLSVER